MCLFWLGSCNHMVHYFIYKSSLNYEDSQLRTENEICNDLHVFIVQYHYDVTKERLY